MEFAVGGGDLAMAVGVEGELVAEEAECVGVGVEEVAEEERVLAGVEVVDELVVDGGVEGLAAVGAREVVEDAEERGRVEGRVGVGVGRVAGGQEGEEGAHGRRYNFIV